MMPFDPPLAEMLWKVRPLAPIVVFATLRAVPVVDVIVFPLPVTLTAVAPPVAVKPGLAPELTDTPEKLNVPPALLARFAPVPPVVVSPRSEEHTSELQSPCNIVCRLLL